MSGFHCLIFPANDSSKQWRGADSALQCVIAFVSFRRRWHPEFSAVGTASCSWEATSFAQNTVFAILVDFVAAMSRLCSLENTIF